MNKRLFFTSAVLSVASIAFADNEIGFVEKFALAPDRAEALKDLVPGSEEYFYYHALHYQNSAQAPQFKAIMAQWAARFPHSEQRTVIENREALLHYDTAPEAAFGLLNNRIPIAFNHTRQEAGEDPTLPVSLDPALISRKAFLERALSENGDALQNFSDDALEALLREKRPLNDAQRKALLMRLQRPDVQGLLELEEAALKSKESRGFGEFPIDRALLPEQLDELGKRIPSLLDSTVFIETRLGKLAPGADEDPEANPKVKEAWLDRLWSAAKDLSPQFASLKAQILAQRLQFDRLHGVYDKARFLEYLKLPRQAGYVNPAYLRRSQATLGTADLSQTYQTVLKAPPVGNDEWLVRDYLLHLLPTETKWEPWAVYLQDTYVKPLFAEAKILNGIGNPQEWASLLSPAAFEALKQRVDLDFQPQNAQITPQEADASLAVEIKNAPKLILRIYEINTLAYYLAQHKQLNTDVNLDGLVANTERPLTFDDAAASGPFRKMARTVDLPELKGKRGAWIVEVIGGGKSIRALIRKGQWTVLQTPGGAGDMLQVLDETRKPVADAVVWYEGRRYAPDEKTGLINIPFSANPGRKEIVLSNAQGTYATLAAFAHHAEDYRLDAQFHVEREQLLSARKATLVIHTTLYAGEAVLPMALLEDQRLSIVASTIDGIATTSEVRPADGLKFEEGKDVTYTFSVPVRLAKLSVTLSGNVNSITGAERKELSAASTWELGMNSREAQNDPCVRPHLAKEGGKYFAELRGKNGEEVAGKAFPVDFRRGDFTLPISTLLKTDAHGRIALGDLEGIVSLTCNGMTWNLSTDDAVRPSAIQAGTGEKIQLPWMGAPGELKREDVSLLEVKNGVFTADKFNSLSIAGELLNIDGLPPGDYSLLLKGAAARNVVNIRISSGNRSEGWILSQARELEAQNAPALQIGKIDTAADTISIQLLNADDSVRVHVTGRHFLRDHQWQIQERLSRFQTFTPASQIPAFWPNLYLSSRALGDEQRYILDRRYAKIFPGNMLTRPGLLLNPWEVRSTDLNAQGSEYGSFPGGTAGGKAAVPPASAAPFATGIAPASTQNEEIDYLATASPALYNLKPDANGIVRLNRKDLGDRNILEIYVSNDTAAVWRSLTLPPVELKVRDLRLSRSLDPQKSFAETREVTPLQKDGLLSISEEQRAALLTYGSVRDLYNLYSTLLPSGELATFEFIARWPSLSAEEKGAKYSKYACHELNFFLSRKDPDFFAQVVKPYLANKKDKTFMDEYLLGADLAKYLDPWRYQQLNTAEHALLARAIPAQATSIARYLADELEVAPKDPAREELLFETALRGKVLSGVNVVEFEGYINYGAPLQDAEKVMLSTEAISGLAPNAPMAAPARMPKSKRELKEDSGKFAFKLAAKPSARTASADGVIGGDQMEETTKAMRETVRQFYRKIGPTKEWAENNYYNIPLERQNQDLIPLGAFWEEYARWDGKTPFLSKHAASASRSFPECMLALAVMDLPFTAEEPLTKVEGTNQVITAHTPLVVYHKEIRPTVGMDEHAGILVSESFLPRADRAPGYSEEEPEPTVEGEFLAGAVYRGRAVVTNSSASPMRASLLLQIPEGALPLFESKVTDGKNLLLQPYSTQKFEYSFYFPLPRAQPYSHYPATVSRDGKGIAAAKQTQFLVVRKFSKTDEASWDFISQYGTDEQLFAYLEGHNIARIDLEMVAWRVKQSVQFFAKLAALMEQRHVYSDVIFSYALYHHSPEALQYLASVRKGKPMLVTEYLQENAAFLDQCGPWLDSPVIRIDPIERRTYQHLEYSPYINQRVQRFGKTDKIANPVLLAQYQEFCKILAHKPKLTSMDLLSAAYYLFLQGRVEEALADFEKVAVAGLPSRVQYDYFKCYAAFYMENPAEARKVAAQYAGYPVDRWKALFAEVLRQADEAEGIVADGKHVESGKPDREQQQGDLASTEPGFDFKITGSNIVLSWKHLAEVQVNYHLMDPEMLFSSSPFVTTDSSRFSFVQPSKSTVVKLPADKESIEIPLPPEYKSANVLVEIVGAGLRKGEQWHANTLRLNLAANYGRLEVRDSEKGNAISKAYVKVYARLKNGQIRFYKDGYTDLRGRFDYASLNTGSGSDHPMPLQAQQGGGSGFDYGMLRPEELGEVERLSLLILTETHGAEVKEVNPPAE